MYKILLHGITNKYELQELIKVFLSPDMFVSYTDAEAEAAAEKDSGYEADAAESARQKGNTGGTDMDSRKMNGFADAASGNRGACRAANPA